MLYTVYGQKKSDVLPLGCLFPETELALVFPTPEQVC